MEAPTLRLEILKGPRAGEALEFKPGKKVGIGRLVRGNAIQIKDDGISSKHLRIEFVADKWLITDLQSSNGTILNGAALDPLVPTLLRDGDVVKIGESTSITVRVRVDSEDVADEANVRRNPRRRAAAAAAGKNAVVESVGLKRARVTEGLDLDEKNKLEGGNDEENPMEDKGRKGVSKKKNVKKVVDDNRPPVQVAESSNVKLENQVQELVTGRRRGRTKKMKAVEEVSEAADEGLEAGNQALKKTRRGRGVRKGRALNEKTGENELSVPVVEVSNQVADASLDERGGLKSDQAVIKKTMEDEAVVVTEKCVMPLLSVPSEDGIKKQTCGGAGRGRVVEHGVVKETPEDAEIVNSESETLGQLVNVKKEKVSMCPSIVNETLCVNSSGVVFENVKNFDGQVPVAVENGVSGMENHETLIVSHETLEAGETLISEKMENVNKLGSLEPSETASVHFVADQSTVPGESYEKDIDDSEKEIHENLQNIKKEKLSICPSTHEKISETFCINSSGSEFGNERNSEYDELEATDAGIAEKAGDMAGLELQEPLEVADILSGIAADAERINSGRNASHGCPAEPGRHGSCSGKGSEVKLDEMTLGQWFDYLEVYLPRQIHDATEDMIASMIEKSKRFQEYVSQQQIGKEKVLASSSTQIND